MSTPGAAIAIPRHPPTRFIAQNGLTGQILHWEVPIGGAQVTIGALSEPQTISGVIAPEFRELRDDTTGRPIIRPNQTWIHFEMDGQIRASGLVVKSDYTGPEWTLECEGFSAYPSGIRYLADYSVTDVDSITVIQEMWRYVQALPLANLGVSVPRPGGQLPNRLGVEKDQDGKTKPFEVLAFDVKDCGSVIADAVSEGPLDLVEHTEWNGTKTGVVRTLRIGYPRAGRRRDDITFTEGENVDEVISLHEGDDYYASVVIGVGAGQGKDAIREVLADPDPERYRREYIYKNQKITDRGQLQRIIADELRWRRRDTHEIQQVVLDAKDYDTPLGSYQVGDDVLVEGNLEHVGWVRIWHRIHSISLDVDADLVTCETRRSESYRYGQEAAT